MTTQRVPVQLPDGRSFPSIRAAARAIGVTDSTVHYALERGTLHTLGKGQNRPKAFSFNDRAFRSLSAASRALGVPFSTLQAWSEKGTLQEKLKQRRGVIP